MYESWTQKKSDIDINGYKCFNLYRNFQNRRANSCSGGIVLYIRDSISDGVKLVRNHYDSIIWIKLDKNFFNIESDIYIAGVYIWGENSPAYNSIDVDFSICCKMILMIFIRKEKLCYVETGMLGWVMVQGSIMLSVTD